MLGAALHTRLVPALLLARLVQGQKKQVMWHVGWEAQIRPAGRMPRPGLWAGFLTENELEDEDGGGTDLCSVLANGPKSDLKHRSGAWWEPLLVRGGLAPLLSTA